MIPQTRVKVLQNTPFGILIGFIAAMIMAASLDGEVASNVRQQYGNIITVCLALAAAGFTVIGVLATIDSQNELSKTARERKLLSARALMPSALQEICEVAEEVARYASSARTDIARQPPKTQLPETSLGVIRDLIELTDDARVSGRLIGLLTEHQLYVENWRRNAMLSGEGRPPEISSITAQWAFLRAVAQSLLPYARYETSSVHTEIAPDTIGLIRQRFVFSGDNGNYRETEDFLKSDFKKKYEWQLT